MTHRMPIVRVYGIHIVYHIHVGVQYLIAQPENAKYRQFLRRKKTQVIMRDMRLIAQPWIDFDHLLIAIDRLSVDKKKRLDVLAKELHSVLSEWWEMKKWPEHITRQEIEEKEVVRKEVGARMRDIIRRWQDVLRSADDTATPETN